MKTFTQLSEELKKSTLQSYVKKAQPSAMSHEVAGYTADRKAVDKSLGTKERTTLANFAKSMYRKSDLRSRGIQKAQHRLKQSTKKNLGEDIKQFPLDETKIGFSKLTKKLAAKGATSPTGLAAYIGRKKYGKKKFQRAAAKGTKLT